jgi:putative oxidoreductase
MSVTVHHHDPMAARHALADVEREQRARKQAVRRRRTYLHVAGRVLLGGMLLTTGLAKALSFDSTARAMDALGLASPALLLSVAIGIELFGGLLLALGLRVREVAVGLMAYLLAVTLNVNGDLTLEVNRAMVVANVGVLGALVMLWSHGAGTLSLDRALALRQARRYRL